MPVFLMVNRLLELAVEHILGMLAQGDSRDNILEGYPWLDEKDIQACLVYAHKTVSMERIESLLLEKSA